MHTQLEKIFSLAIANKASDIHLIMGASPRIRINGNLIEIPGWSEVDDVLTKEMILSMLNEKQKEKLELKQDLDFSFDAQNSRFRANIYFQKRWLVP